MTLTDQETAAITALAPVIGAVAVSFGVLTPMQDQTLLTAGSELVGAGIGVWGVLAAIWQSSHPANAQAAARSIAKTDGTPQAAAVTGPVVAALTDAGFTVTAPKSPAT